MSANQTEDFNFDEVILASAVDVAGFKPGGKVYWGSDHSRSIGQIIAVEVREDGIYPTIQWSDIPDYPDVASWMRANELERRVVQNAAASAQFYKRLREQEGEDLEVEVYYDMYHDRNRFIVTDPSQCPTHAVYYGGGRCHSCECVKIRQAAINATMLRIRKDVERFNY